MTSILVLGGAILLGLLAIALRILAGGYDEEEDDFDGGGTVEIATGGDIKGNSDGQLIGVVASGDVEGVPKENSNSKKGNTQGENGLEKQGGERAKLSIAGGGGENSSSGTTIAMAPTNVVSDGSVNKEGSGQKKDIQQTVPCSHCGAINNAGADSCWSCGSCPSSMFESGTGNGESEVTLVTKNEGERKTESNETESDPSDDENKEDPPGYIQQANNSIVTEQDNSEKEQFQELTDKKANENQTDGITSEAEENLPGYTTPANEVEDQNEDITDYSQQSSSLSDNESEINSTSKTGENQGDQEKKANHEARWGYELE